MSYKFRILILAASLNSLTVVAKEHTTQPAASGVQFGSATDTSPAKTAAKSAGASRGVSGGSTGGSKQASVAIVRDGDTTRANIAKMSDNFAANVAKISENSNAVFAKVGAITDTDSLAAGIAAIQSLGERPVQDTTAMDKTVADIAAAYKSMADMKFQEVALKLQAALPPTPVPVATAATASVGDQLKQFQSSGAQNALGLAQGASSASATNLSQLGGAGSKSDSSSNSGGNPANPKLSHGSGGGAAVGFLSSDSESQRGIQQGISDHGYRVPASVLGH